MKSANGGKVDKCYILSFLRYFKAGQSFSVLPRIFRVVAGFYIAFSAVYPVYT